MAKNIWRGLCLCVGVPFLVAGYGGSLGACCLGWAILMLGAPLYVLSVFCIWFVGAIFYRPSGPPGDNSIFVAFTVLEVVGYLWVGTKIIWAVQEAERKRELEEGERRKAEICVTESLKAEHKFLVVTRKFGSVLNKSSSVWCEMILTLRALNGFNMSPSLADAAMIGVLDVVKVITQAQENFPSSLESLCRAMSRRLLRIESPDDGEPWSRKIDEWDNKGIAVPGVVAVLSEYDKTHGTGHSRVAATAYRSLVTAIVASGKNSRPVKVVEAEYARLLEPFLQTPQPASNGGRHPVSPGSSSCAACNEALRTMDLPLDADEKQVKSARRELSKSLHPDVWQGKRGAQLVEEQLQKVNAAYDHLMSCAHFARTGSETKRVVHKRLKA